MVMHILNVKYQNIFTKSRDRFTTHTKGIRNLFENLIGPRAIALEIAWPDDEERHERPQGIDGAGRGEKQRNDWSLGIQERGAVRLERRRSRSVNRFSLC